MADAVLGERARPPPPADLPPGTTRILVLGDSEASFLGLALRYRQDEAGAFVAERGVGECSIFAQGTRAVEADPPVTTSCSSAWVEDTAALRPDVTLIVMGGAFLNARACEEAWLSRYRARLLDLFHRMGDGAGRIVLARVPYPMGRWRHSDVQHRVDCFDAMLERTAGVAHADVLDLMGHVCPTPACVAESQGQPVRPDGLHFDGVGAEETARWTLAALRRPLVAPSSGHP